MYNQPINLDTKFAKFADLWSPKIIAKMNDYKITIVRVKGDFVWHKHDNTDDFFFVIEGTLRIDLEGKDSIYVKAGEVAVVKKGDVHKTYAENECKIMLI